MDNIRVKQESPSDWRTGFEIEEGKKKGLDGKACWDGYKLAGTKKKGGKTVDNCVKEDQGAVSYNTSDWRNEFHPTEIESIDIIKNEPLVNEGRTTTVKGIKVRGSGHPKDSASGTNDKPLLDYSKIRANAPVKTDTKVG